MALEALDFVDPPTFLDLEDGGQAYNMGIRFQVTEVLPCAGIQWVKVPATVSAPPGGTHVASIWTLDEQQQAAAAFVPTPGADEQNILFSAPVNLLVGVDYVAAIYTVHYVFRASGGVWPTSPSGRIVSDIGRLVAYNGGPSVIPDSFPSGSSAGLFYISPLVGTVDVEPAEGSADVGLDIAPAATGAAAHRGVAAAGLALAVAATGAAPARGSANVVLNLAAAAVGARASRGVAALGLNLAVSASGPVPAVPPGGPPRLVSSTRPDAITSVSRPDAITTSTRG